MLGNVPLSPPRLRGPFLAQESPLMPVHGAQSSETGSQQGPYDPGLLVGHLLLFFLSGRPFPVLVFD